MRLAGNRRLREHDSDDGRGRGAGAGNQAGVDRPRRPHPRGTRLRDGPDRAQPRDPDDQRELQPTSAQLLWIIDIYGFLVAGLLITMGTLGDRIGRRRLLLGGAAGFAIASLLAAFSTSSEMLIASRALMGIAGATIAPSTLSLIFTMFLDPKQRSTAIGVWIAAYSAGGAIGPVLGGVLLEFFWWGSVFLIGVPVMGAPAHPGSAHPAGVPDPNARPLDLRSVAMSLLAILGVVYGLKEIAQDGLAPMPLALDRRRRR